MKKRFLSILLAIMMVIGLLPTSALLAEPSPPTNLRWDGYVARWDAVDGASSYSVELCRDDQSITGGASLTPDWDYSSFMVPGQTYTFKVVVKISGSESSPAVSAPLTVPGTIGTITGITWDEYKLSWTPVTGAKYYNVTLYKDGSQVHSDWQLTAAEYDFTSKITDKGAGEYYVKVEADHKVYGNTMATGTSETITVTPPEYTAYTIVFDANGGTVAPTFAKTGADGKLAELPTPTREGYTFDGWFTAAEGGTEVTLDKVYTANAKIYAQWTEVPAPTPEIWVGGVGMKDGDYLANDATATTTDKPTTGGYAYYNDGVLTLNNYTYTGDGYDFSGGDYACVYTENDLKLILEGTNSLTAPTNKDSNAVFVEGTLTIEGTKLTAGAAQGILAEGDITINSGEISVTAGDYNGICAYGDVSISGGEISVTASEARGIRAYGDVTVSGGEVKIDCESTGIAADDEKTIKISGAKLDISSDDSNGLYANEIIIEDSTVEINANGDGIYANESVTIDQCELLDITAGEYYGGIIAIAGDIIIEASKLKIDESDVGIRAQGGNVSITGSELDVTVCLDAISAGKTVSISNYSTVSAKTTFTKAESDDIYMAIKCNAFAIDSTMTIQASTEPDGTLGEYVEANHDTYDYIKIEPAAASTPEIWVGGVGMVSGQYLDESGNLGTEALTDNYAYYKDGVLTLNNYTYSGDGYKFSSNSYACIYTENDLKLVLEGTNNSLTGSADKDSYAVYVEGTLTIEGTKLTADAWNTIIAGEDLNINSGEIVATASRTYSIYAGDNIVINGGKITVTADADDGIDGIFAAGGDVNIKGGTVEITAGCNGVYALWGDISISGGTVKIEADEDGIHAFDGSISIEDGTVTIEAGNDGINAFSDVTINGGTVNIEANDDGILLNDGNVTISGGTVVLDAGKDGIDAGTETVTISGGELDITSSNNGIIADYVIIEDGVVEIEAGEDGIYADIDVTIEDGTVDITAAENGIVANYQSITINGGTVIVKSTNTTADDNYFALNAIPITIADTLTAQASTEPDGSNPAPYDETENNTYDWVKIEPAPTEYDITVIGGTASVGAGTAVTKATTGTEITLTVDESAIPAGKVFDKWEVVSGGVTVTDGKFTMPESAVEIKATYKDAPVAPTEIDSVNLTDFAVPSDGDNASDGDPAAIAESGKGYTFKYGTWFDSTGSTQFTGTFEAGETYIALLTLRAEEGYEFAPTGSISATVNGGTLTVKEVSVGSYYRANDTADVLVEFTVAEGGETPAPTEYDITVTGGTASVGAGTPVDKATVGTEITLTVDESAIPAGKVFDKWEVVSGGVTITDGKFTMPESAVEIKATYKDAPVIPTEINISELPSLTVGDNITKAMAKNVFPAGLTFIGNTPYVAVINGALIGQPTKAEADTNYYLYATWDLEDYTEIPDASQYVVKYNGTALTYTPNNLVKDNEQSGYYFFEANGNIYCRVWIYLGKAAPAVQPTVIDEIKIEGLPAPQYGQTVEQYWNAYLQNESNGVLTINGEKLSGEYFGNLYFAGNDLFDGNMDPYDDTDATFTPGTYYFYLCLKPANGYTFADSLNVSVKDVESANVDAEFNDENDLTKPVYIYVEYEVTAPATHTCDIKPVAKDEPSCTEGGKEAYYKCEGCGKFYEDALGAKEITDLANWGNLPKLGHTESDWKSDKDNHWKECTVTACGVIIEDSKAAHKDDNKDGKCDVCEYNVGLPTTPDEDKPNDNPQTGDNNNMFLWIALLFVSGLSVVETVFGKRKFSVK